MRPLSHEPMIRRYRIACSTLPLSRSAILKDQPHYDEYDVHQGTLFLHDNGILLHFPEASLSDLYFINPQWLSTVLAKVISIPELRRYHRNGESTIANVQGSNNT